MAPPWVEKVVRCITGGRSSGRRKESPERPDDSPGLFRTIPTTNDWRSVIIAQMLAELGVAHLVRGRSTKEMLVDRNTTVCFFIHKRLFSGMSIEISGSHPYLGEWDPDRALRTKPVAPMWWGAVVELPSGATYSWHCAILRSRDRKLLSAEGGRRLGFVYFKDHVVLCRWNHCAELRMRTFDDLQVNEETMKKIVKGQKERWVGTVYRPGPADVKPPTGMNGAVPRNESRDRGSKTDLPPSSEKKESQLSFSTPTDFSSSSGILGGSSSPETEEVASKKGSMPTIDLNDITQDISDRKLSTGANSWSLISKISRLWNRLKTRYGATLQESARDSHSNGDTESESSSVENPIFKKVRTPVRDLSLKAKISRLLDRLKARCGASCLELLRGRHSNGSSEKLLVENGDETSAEQSRSSRIRWRIPVRLSSLPQSLLDCFRSARVGSSPPG